MNLFNAVLVFCALQPNSIKMSDTQYQIAKTQCQTFVITCIDKNWSDKTVGDCMDKYNLKFRPNRECRNNLEGDCK